MYYSLECADAQSSLERISLTSPVFLLPAEHEFSGNVTTAREEQAVKMSEFTSRLRKNLLA